MRSLFLFEATLVRSWQLAVEGVPCLRAYRASVPARLSQGPCLGLGCQHACQPGTARVISVPGRAVPCLARVAQAEPLDPVCASSSATLMDPSLRTAAAEH